MLIDHDHIKNVHFFSYPSNESMCVNTLIQQPPTEQQLTLEKWRCVPFKIN